MSKVEERLKELGFELPPAPKPAAVYVPAVRTGNLVFISGQGVTYDGKPVMVGHVGQELTLEEGYKAAQICALNALAVLKQEIGDLDKVKRIVKVLGWVNSAPGFNKQPYVINGFSELMEKVFGERGRHARSAVTAHELPFDTPVEVEMVVEVEE
ncbi:MAG: RidA family protein [Limnochordaceae bacterium]|nr:RidA family protein [Limnochordaceae bacterium]